MSITSTQIPTGMNQILALAEQEMNKIQVLEGIELAVSSKLADGSLHVADKVKSNTDDMTSQATNAATASMAFASVVAGLGMLASSAKTLCAHPYFATPLKAADPLVSAASKSVEGYFSAELTQKKGDIELYKQGGKLMGDSSGDLSDEAKRVSQFGSSFIRSLRSMVQDNSTSMNG